MNTVPQFPEEDIPLILEAFYNCGKTLFKITENELENRLTRKLARRLKKEDIFRDGPLRIESNIELFRDDSSIDDTAIDGILDFRVTSSLNHPEVYFVVEAKRLNVKFKGKVNSLAKEYVTEGMLRFTSKKYAPMMSKHSMLGYVFDLQVQDAIASIKQAIINRQSELKMPTTDFSPSSILHNVSIYSTKHGLFPDECEIFHLLLPVPTKA